MSELPSAPVLPKRFYETVSLDRDGDDYLVKLDGRGIRTPARAVLAVPSQGVAEAIAAEWQRQRDVIDPATMPVTRLANTVIDGVRTQPTLTIDDLCRYAETDLLAYRADEPERLALRQSERWDPILHWVRERLGIPFATGTGVMFVSQTPETVAALQAAVRAESDPFRLAALHQTTTLTGSLVLALALSEGRVTPDELWSLAHVDEDWNIELWGEDAEAQARRSNRFEDLRAAALLLGRL